MLHGLVDLASTQNWESMTSKSHNPSIIKGLGSTWLGCYRNRIWSISKVPKITMGTQLLTCWWMCFQVNVVLLCFWDLRTDLLKFLSLERIVWGVTYGCNQLSWFLQKLAFFFSCFSPEVRGNVLKMGDKFLIYNRLRGIQYTYWRLHNWTCHWKWSWSQKSRVPVSCEEKNRTCPILFILTSQ